MIRVLIVEDEPPIARVISRMIGELYPAFTVAGCEINGKDALEHMRREPVDLVVTDIRMPVMDGLKLMEALKRDWPDCMAAVLSGHQDFAYAQTALRLGAFDYLLKPISRDKLHELLRRAQEAHNRRLMQKAVASWRSGKEAAVTDAPFSAGTYYALILALAGHWPSIPDDAHSPGAVFWQANDPDALIGNLTGPSSNAITFVGRAAAERVFLLENTAPNHASLLAQTLFARLARLSELPKTLCLMPGPLNFTDIGRGIRIARERVYKQTGLCRSALLWEPETDDKGGAPPELPPKPLVEALLVRNSEQIRRAVDAAVDTAISNDMTQIAFERFLETVIYDRRLSFESKALKYELGESVLGAASPGALKAGLTQIFKLYSLGEGKAELNSLVKRIELYLSTHYAEDITTETLSAKFGFVPSYLSKVFRRQTGKSPTEYLTDLRIERAKSLMETRNDLLVRDVALLVGFNDPHYFSKLFRKMTGLLPSQYQDEVLKRPSL